MLQNRQDAQAADAGRPGHYDTKSSYCQLIFIFRFKFCVKKQPCAGLFCLTIWEALLQIFFLINPTGQQIGAYKQNDQRQDSQPGQSLTQNRR